MRRSTPPVVESSSRRVVKGDRLGGSTARRLDDSVRFFAFVVLALLGAPVAMHVVLHDLHAHHDEHAMAVGGEHGHGDHEHPIVASPAPQIPAVTHAALPVAIVPAATAATWSVVATNDRNVLSAGALRTDTDVGLQPLLATFLI